MLVTCAVDARSFEAGSRETRAELAPAAKVRHIFAEQGSGAAMVREGGTVLNSGSWTSSTCGMETSRRLFERKAEVVIGERWEDHAQPIALVAQRCRTCLAAEFEQMADGWWTRTSESKRARAVEAMA